MEDFIEIDLVSNFNHAWPDCKICLNSVEIYNSKIIKSKKIITKVNFKSNNQLSIEHFNKRGSDTPLLDDLKYQLYFDDKNLEDIKEHLWLNKENPKLTYKERFRRTIAIWEEAAKYKWPINEAKRRLLTIQSLVNKIKKETN